MRTLVGVGVVVIRDARVLLGKRRGAHGASTWALPGGHLEAGESVEACAARETAEETGLVIANLRPAGYSSNVFADIDRHYVTLFVEASSVSGDVQRLEPDKCERWAWFDWHALPQPLFAPLQSLLDQGYAPTFM